MERKLTITEEPGVIHAGPADGTDFTLCGMAYEGENGGAEAQEVRGRINCPRCVSIILHCKSYRATDIEE